MKREDVTFASPEPWMAPNFCDWLGPVKKLICFPYYDFSFLSICTQNSKEINKKNDFFHFIMDDIISYLQEKLHLIVENE